MQCVITNAVRMCSREFLRVPLWSIVSSLTGHGSGFSIEICKELNLDPNQIVRTRNQALTALKVSTAPPSHCRD